VNAKDKDGYTALMYVAYSGNLEIAKILIKNGADVNVRDKDRWTALMFARMGKKADITELLKKSGAGK
jgi:ankyrin repeat protein